MDTYKVIPYDDRTQKHNVKDLADWLPRHEFLMVIVAPAGSGKTTLLLNMLLRLYKQYWHQIFIFSPTIHNDAKWQHVFDESKILLSMEKNAKEHFKQTRIKMITWCKEHITEDKQELPTSSSLTEPYTLEKNKITLQRKKNTLAKKTTFNRKNNDLYSHKKSKGHTYNINEQEASNLLKQHIQRRQRLAQKIVAPLPPDTQKALKEYKSVILNMKYIQEPHKEYNEHNSLDSDGSCSDDTPHTTKDKGLQSIPKELTFEEPKEEVLQYLMDQQDKEVLYWQKKQKALHLHVPRTLFVFDDMVGSGLFNRRQNNAFKRLTVRRRHLYSSVIGVTQAYKEIPKTTRTNANSLILFRIDSEEELATIYSEYPMGMKWQHWERVVEFYTREPYSFIMFNLQTSDPNMRIISNFDTPLSLETLARFKHPQSSTSEDPDDISMSQ
jgi:hypothetical protein